MHVGLKGEGNAVQVEEPDHNMVHETVSQLSCVSMTKSTRIMLH